MIQLMLCKSMFLLIFPDGGWFMRVGLMPNLYNRVIKLNDILGIEQYSKEKQQVTGSQQFCYYRE